MRITFHAVLVLVALGSATAFAQAPATAPVQRAADPGHGQYLVERVAMCVECHSERDAAGQIIPGRKFMGGLMPPRPTSIREWADRAPRNAGLPGYDDAAALRLLTQGAIARDGRQLMAPMPRFRMTREDALDVIAYLRSIQ